MLRPATRGGVLVGEAQEAKQATDALRAWASLLGMSMHVRECAAVAGLFHDVTARRAARERRVPPAMPRAQCRAPSVARADTEGTCAAFARERKRHA